MRKGEIVDTVGMSRKKQRKLQHGYHFLFEDRREDDFKLTKKQMALWNLGRKRPKQQVKKLKAFLVDRSIEEVTVEERTWMSVWGILLVCIGLVGTLLSALIGCFAEDNAPKRPRRRYQPRKAR